MKNRPIIMSDEQSLNRPAWTSIEETGMFHAYRHKHISNPRSSILKNYFVKTVGIVR